MALPAADSYPDRRHHRQLCRMCERSQIQAITRDALLLVDIVGNKRCSQWLARNAILAGTSTDRYAL